MTESKPAVIGMQSCGCITYANAAPEHMDNSDAKALARVIREGGQVIRTTVDEARAMPHFLLGECPHTPRGWTPTPAIDRGPKLRTEIHRGRDLRIVYLAHRRLGEVRKWDGVWEATRGWFSYRAPGAGDGKSDDGAAEVLRPFPSMRAAMEALT